MTVQKKITDICAILRIQLIVVQKAREFCFNSLAPDESTDLKPNAQLLMSIRDVDENFKTTEEITGLYSVSGQCQVVQPEVKFSVKR